MRADFKDIGSMTSPGTFRVGPLPSGERRLRVYPSSSWSDEPALATVTVVSGEEREQEASSAPIV